MRIVIFLLGALMMALAAVAAQTQEAHAYINHAIHAVDPNSVAREPGLGYELIYATIGAAAHIIYAAGADDASDDVKAYAERARCRHLVG